MGYKDERVTGMESGDSCECTGHTEHTCITPLLYIVKTVNLLYVFLQLKCLLLQLKGLLMAKYLRTLNISLWFCHQDYLLREGTARTR